VASKRQLEANRANAKRSIGLRASLEKAVRGKTLFAVQMQVSPMDLVGLGSHDRREQLAAAVMYET
jgi:hypothetical protein